MRFTALSIAMVVLGCVAGVSAAPKGFGRRGQEAPTAVNRRASSSGALDTNAKRLAAGLPPLPARRLWSPTTSAKRWSTSPVPHMGKFGIKAANGSSLGFLSAALNANGGYTVDADETKAANLFFSAPQALSATGLFIKDLTSNSTNATFIGAVIPRNFTLVSATGTVVKRDASTQTDHITMSGVGQTSSNSPPQTVPTTAQSANATDTSGGSAASGQDGESSVWNYDPSTSMWTLTWMNYDGSAVDTSPYYNPGSSSSPSSINWVSNTDSYQSSNPDSVPITMNFAG